MKYGCMAPFNGLMGYTAGNSTPITDLKYRYGVGPRIAQINEQPYHYREFGRLDGMLQTSAIKTEATHTSSTGAVGLNDYEESDMNRIVHFALPLESIGASSSTPGATRIERGFLGAHADIGGGFKDNDLSKVALAWMLEQATTAGVKMDESPITIPASAVLHDKSNNIQTGQPVETCALCTGGEDRTVHGAVSGTTQRTIGFGAGNASMTYADTQDPNNQFITYQDRSTLPRYTLADVWDEEKRTGIKGVTRTMVGQLKTDVTGTVNMVAYVAWLKLNGYSLDNLKVQ